MPIILMAHWRAQPNGMAYPGISTGDRTVARGPVTTEVLDATTGGLVASTGGGTTLVRGLSDGPVGPVG